MTEANVQEKDAVPEKPRVADWLIPNATVFVASGCIMIVELVAGRIVSRHLGQSLYTWTSVIGVVLAGISLGNYSGGRIADRFTPRRSLAVLFILSSLSCLLVPVLNQLVGGWSWLWERSWPVRIVTHVFLTFMLPSTMLGTISPVVAKMALNRSRHTGRTIGDVYAWGAIGSIVGTFLAGFYLIAAMGTAAITVTVAVVLAVMAVLYGLGFWVSYLWMAACVAGWWLAVGPGEAVAGLGRDLLLREAADPHVVYRDESQYSYIAVKANAENRNERAIYLDKLEHSIIDITNPLDLKYPYTWVYEAVLDTVTEPGTPVRAMVLGGGGYAFPQYLELSRPGSHVIVAEIDPAVTEAAFAACGLRSDTTIVIHNMDARNLVDDLAAVRGRGEAFEPLDFVFGDSINDFSVPYQLTTEEFARQLRELLAPDGLYLLNLIDVFTSGRFLGAVVNTCRRVFDQVYVFSCGDNLDGRNTFVVVCAARALDLSGVADRIRGRRSFSGDLLTTAQLDDLAERTKGLVLTDDYAPVENLLAAVVRQDPGDVLERYTQAGVDAAARGDMEGAIREFTAVTRINPGYARGYYNLGVALAQSGRPQEALDAYAAAVQLDADFVDARNNAAMILAQAGQLDAAVAQWREVIRTRPDSAVVHNNLGNALAQMGRVDEAVQHWIKAIAIQPDYASPHNNLGNAFNLQGKLDEAVLHYREALRLQPDLAQAHNNLGDLLARQGKTDEAILHFAEALRLEPGLVQAREKLDALRAQVVKGQ